MRKCRTVLQVALLAAGLALPALAMTGNAAHAQEAAAGAVALADRAAIRAVIQAQLDAFQHDDAAAAFAFAAPNIRHVFQDDPAVFLGMVRQGYQPVYRPRSTVFGAASIAAGQVTQKLELVGPDGAGHEAVYVMEREPDGSWKIAGCMLTDTPSVGA